MKPTRECMSVRGVASKINKSHFWHYHFSFWWCGTHSDNWYSQRHSLGTHHTPSIPHLRSEPAPALVDGFFRVHVVYEEKSIYSHFYIVGCYFPIPDSSIVVVPRWNLCWRPRSTTSLLLRGWWCTVCTLRADVLRVVSWTGDALSVRIWKNIFIMNDKIAGPVTRTHEMSVWKSRLLIIK